MKDREHYLRLDLSELAARIPDERAERLRSDELSDIINAVYHRCGTEPISVAELRALLGEPDAAYPRADGVVWEYAWIGRHGPDEYESSTPFLIQHGRVAGIASDA